MVNCEIFDLIKKHRRVSFAKFMEWALYHPSQGYYMSPRSKIGAEGDFYTSSNVSPLFGNTLAGQIAQLWQLSGCLNGFNIVEYGAGNGFLTRDILTHLLKHHKTLYENLVYYIVEISPFMRRQQRELLEETFKNKVVWLSRLQELPRSCPTVILANELVDAFPVHRLIYQNGQWQEICVTWQEDEDKLLEEAVPIAQRDLLEYIDIYVSSCQEGQIIEVNLVARQWLTELWESLSRGYVLIIDYGGTSQELYNESRLNGTLRAYYRHNVRTDFLSEPGEMDLTADVNFSALQNWASELGFSCLGYTSQMNFLINAGILDLINNSEAYIFNSQTLRDTLQVKKLILPEGMGSRFKVLLLGKNVPDIKPSGFQAVRRGKQGWTTADSARGGF
ncbi:MAG: class I SAM-dependent methyltransferase [Bacillota bacterium]